MRLCHKSPSWREKSTEKDSESHPADKCCEISGQESLIQSLGITDTFMKQPWGGGVGGQWWWLGCYPVLPARCCWGFLVGLRLLDDCICCAVIAVSPWELVSGGLLWAALLIASPFQQKGGPCYMGRSLTSGPPAFRTGGFRFDEPHS